MWRIEWPDWVRQRLVSSDIPTGDITNSDLELAGGLILIQLEALALAQTFDIRERTVLSLEQR